MVKSDDWFPKGVIKLEDAALEVVKDVTNCLVIAGPGAGKIRDPERKPGTAAIF